LRQQSHHCGIETRALRVCQSHTPLRSNRTIVGLKHGTERKKVQSTKQQSHHCGIETVPGMEVSSSEGVQQSHHCGIETSEG